MFLEVILKNLKIIYNMFGHTNFRHSIGRTPDREPIKTILQKIKLLKKMLNIYTLNTIKIQKTY